MLGGLWKSEIRVWIRRNSSVLIGFRVMPVVVGRAARRKSGPDLGVPILTFIYVILLRRWIIIEITVLLPIVDRQDACLLC